MIDEAGEHSSIRAVRKQGLYRDSLMKADALLRANVAPKEVARILKRCSTGVPEAQEKSSSQLLSQLRNRKKML